MFYSHSRSPRRGFTLIELLVVIAIIAILAAILFPVFARAREKARESACVSNCSQIGKGLMMYAQDYDERYPFSSYGPDSRTSPAQANPRTVFNTYYCQNLNTRCSYTYADMLMPYVKNTKIFACPSDSTNWANYDSRLERLSYGITIYAFTRNNNLLSGREQGPGPTLAEIPRPADKIFIGETGNGQGFFGLWCFASPQLNHHQDRNNCNDKRGSLPMVYFDGHAKVYQMRGLGDRAPYPVTCSNTPACMEQHFPEWCPWLDR